MAVSNRQPGATVVYYFLHQGTVWGSDRVTGVELHAWVLAADKLLLLKNFAQWAHSWTAEDTHPDSQRGRQVDFLECVLLERQTGGLGAPGEQLDIDHHGARHGML